MPSTRHQQRWQLTQESLACLIRTLGPDEQTAVARYQRLYGRLVFFFMRFRFVSPESLTDEVIDRLARKVTEGFAVENIEAFALGLARMVALEERSRSTRNQTSVAELERNGSRKDHTSHEQQIAFEVMEAQLARIPSEARLMLSRYHEGAGISRIRERQRLADELGISIGTLRKRIFDMQTVLRMKFREVLGEAGSRKI